MTRSATLTAGLWAVLLLLVLAPAAAAQSGKIAGRVTDATGESIPGANVFVVETSTGATSDLDGYYTVLNVRPGSYTLRISYIGYTTQTIENVAVNIDQTTTIDVELQNEDLGLGEVTVRAEQPVVQPDVSNSQANVSAAEIEALPASSVENVVQLQAGVQDGFSIRGSSSDEIAFQVNGLTLRDERNNSPYTNISLASVQAVQVQTGGFNAEYGNVRSGVVNVVTKDGSRDRYEADVILRYSPPAQKNSGQAANDLDSYWIRPFVDPDVAFTGTANGAWDRSTQEQYHPFSGWISVSEDLLSNDDPSDDMTPEALLEAFLWQRRKVMEITNPDYDVDFGFGGPIPGVSRLLGDLRFYASYRREENMYLVPLKTDRYTEQTGHLKLTSNFGDGMKLSVEGRLGGQDGTSASRSGGTGLFRSSSGIASTLGNVPVVADSRIFSSDYYNPTEVRTNQLGATFTHAVSEKTFYEIRANRFGSLYDTRLGAARDTNAVVFFGGVGFDEAPFGYEQESTFGIGGIRIGAGMSNARDTSRVAVYNIKGDVTSQLNRFMQVKTGIELNVTDSNVNYGRFDAVLPSFNNIRSWNETPVRGALYGQTKLEFNGMIANLGLRADYFHAGGQWYEFDPFDPAFSSKTDPIAAIDTLLVTEDTQRILTLSPRLGVSFPVTSVSKLYFNYGHFRSLPDPENLYLVDYLTASGRIDRVANPNNPLPKTVAYEVGYEQSFFDQFLVRTAGYYKDVTLQTFLVRYFSRNGEVEYSLSQPDDFEDIRGFELTLAKNRGRWFQGFVNYTYMVYTDGFFGSRRVFENSTQQRIFDLQEAENRTAQSRPVPRPYARVNLDFIAPNDFGPMVAGIRPLGGWRASLIGRWQDGGQYTWADGGQKDGVLNNVDRTDFTQLDLRFTREFNIGSRRVTFFADIFNVFDQQRLSFNGFYDGLDERRYLASLHLPESDDYSNIPGSDRVGTYRGQDVGYVPIRQFQNRAADAPTGDSIESNALYYENETGSYLEFRDGAYVAADPNRVQDVLDSKAYIDMPNYGFFTFLNPRDVYLGLRISL
ncbi:MAG: hypothetical protein Rubg2KO_35990 [Rubricoccaceae bacterium]